MDWLCGRPVRLRAAPGADLRVLTRCTSRLPVLSQAGWPLQRARQPGVRGVDQRLCGCWPAVHHALPWLRHRLRNLPLRRGEERRPPRGGTAHAAQGAKRCIGPPMLTQRHVPPLHSAAPHAPPLAAQPPPRAGRLRGTPRSRPASSVLLIVQPSDCSPPPAPPHACARVSFADGARGGPG